MDSSCAPFCCGVREFGNFDLKPGSYSWENEVTPVTKARAKELFDNILHEMRNDPAGYNMAWFMKPKGTRVFEAAELIKLIKTIPGVVEFPAVKNPNSGNKIKGYVWKNS